MPPKKTFTKKFVPASSKTKYNINAKYLIIVESPSKCSKIEGFLGEDYCCIASMGHFRTIDGLKAIDTKETFHAKYSLIEDKQQHVTIMRDIISKFSNENIYLASDDDREGEAIAWHICDVFKLPVETTKRIIFHEITKTAIVNAVKTPTKINMNLVYAQQARQVLDMLVGYKISPFLWKYLYQDKANSLSAGRCQTPALRLIYDNSNEKNKDLETKYKTIGKFTAENIKFELNHEFDNSQEVLNFLEKTKTHLHLLTIGKPKETKSVAPKPFNTSRLLQSASNVLSMSPKETMSLCQTLYQNGYITYMRTDSMKYSNAFLMQIEKYVLAEYKKEYLGDLSSIENKDENNPHEAIRVTHIENDRLQTSDNTRLSSLYRLIWKNTIQSCMADAKCNNIQLKITAPLENHYNYTIEIPVFLGWKKVIEKGETFTDKQITPSSLLLYFQTLENTKKPIEYKTIDSSVVVRNKHSHYTEASLINTLEELGIGRPSTFASIVDTIQERGYVKNTNIEGMPVLCTDFVLNGKVLTENKTERIFGNEKNKLVIQPVGILTVEFLIEHFNSLFEYKYTKTMEDKLDNISGGIDIEWTNVCRNCYNEIKELSKPVAKLEKQTFKLDETRDLVFEKFGPVIRVRLEDGSFEYKNAKKNIDIEKVKRNEYTIDELYEIKDNCLGVYQDNTIFIKNGKFGPYVEWGDKRESIKKINKPLDKINIDDVVAFLEGNNKEDLTVLRVLSPELNIRRGKYGAYAFYKPSGATKPLFLNIKKFKKGFAVCDADELIEWIKQTYNLP